MAKRRKEGTHTGLSVLYSHWHGKPERISPPWTASSVPSAQRALLKVIWCNNYYLGQTSFPMSERCTGHWGGKNPPSSWGLEVTLPQDLPSQKLVWHRQGSSAFDQLSSWWMAAMGRWESLQGEATLFSLEVRINFETGIFTFSVRLSTSAIMEFLNRVAAVRGLLVTSVMLSFPSGHIIFNTGLELQESLFNCSVPSLLPHWQSNSWLLPRATAASSSQGTTQARVTLLGTAFCALQSKFKLTTEHSGKTTSTFSLQIRACRNRTVKIPQGDASEAGTASLAQQKEFNQHRGERDPHHPALEPVTCVQAAFLHLFWYRKQFIHFSLYFWRFQAEENWPWWMARVQEQTKNKHIYSNPVANLSQALMCWKWCLGTGFSRDFTENRLNLIKPHKYFARLLVNGKCWKQEQWDCSGEHSQSTQRTADKFNNCTGQQCSPLQGVCAHCPLSRAPESCRLQNEDMFNARWRKKSSVSTSTHILIGF